MYIPNMPAAGATQAHMGIYEPLGTNWTEQPIKINDLILICKSQKI